MKPRLATTLCLAAALLASPSLRAGEPVLDLDSGGHRAEVKALAFSHNGQFLVSADLSGEIRVWNATTGEPIRRLRGPWNPLLALSPGNRLLATASRGPIRVLDFTTGQQVALLKGPTGDALSLAFSPDSRLLASAGDDEMLRLWDVTTRKMLWSVPKAGWISTLSFSPDGTRLLTGGTRAGFLLRDTATGKLIHRLGKQGEGGRSAAISPTDGRLAATMGDGKILLWDIDNKSVLATLQGWTDTLAFTSDGRQLSTIDADMYSQGALNIFSVPEGKLLKKVPLPCKVSDFLARAVALSPDSQLAAIGEGNEICLLPLDKGRPERRLKSKGLPVWSVGFSADGRSIVFGNGLSSAGGNDRSPLEQTFLLGNEDRPELSLGGRWTADGQAVRALESFGPYQLRPKPGFEIMGLGPVPGGFEILQDGRVIREVSGARGFTFSRNGRHVISDNRSVITVSDLKTGKEVRSLRGHTGDVLSLAVSPDGRTLVSGSEDQTFRLWDLESGSQLLAVFVSSEGEWIAWTPAGYYTASAQGEPLFEWRMDQEKDGGSEYLPPSRFQSQYRRPEVVAQYLRTGDVRLALQQALAQTSGTGDPSAQAAQPPLIYIVEPSQDDLVVQQETVRIRAVAISNGLPVTNLQVSLNGVQIAGQPGTLTKGTPQQREIEMEVTLQPGENILTFAAAHEKASSAPLVRRLRYEPAPGTQAGSAAKPDLFLLAIGISEYADSSLALSYAESDAKALVRAFRTQEGRLFGKVVPRLLPGPEAGAGRGDILRALDWLSRQGTAKDLRILFLSGHGGLDGRGNFYFFSQERNPRDEPEIDSVRWDRVFESLAAGSARTILMIDACHAGAAGPPPLKASADLTRIIQELSRLTPRLVTFAASTGEEVSLELQELGHGAFTYALIEGLLGRADGFGGGDQNGRIDTEELGAWLKRRVGALTDNRQHPLFDSGGSPPFDLFVPPGE